MFFCNFYTFPTLSWAFLTLFQLYIITTNRLFGAVGVEEINGLVQNTKGLVVEIPKGSLYEMPNGSRYEETNGSCTKCQMGCVQMPNAVNANAY